MTRDGIEVVELVFDAHGREQDSPNPRHMRDVLREVHRALTKEGTRDLVTLIASGGIAQAEHVAKAIICGADLVAIDLPLMIALECRLCGECERGETCPIHLEEIGEEFAVQRIVNMMAAWRNQLLELLGAMGIREVRRLRGETGRCMFFEDLEAATFGRMFGKGRDEGSTGTDTIVPAVSATRPGTGGSAWRELARREGPARTATRAPTVPKRNRQVPHPSGFPLRGLRQVRQHLPPSGSQAPRGLPVSHSSPGLPLHRFRLREDGPLLRCRVSRRGALAVGESGIRDHGGLPLDARPACQHVGHGGNGPPAPCSSRVRDRGFGGRL